MPTVYCTPTDVAQVAAKFQGLTPEETTRALTAITQAQAQVETMTGAFFYNAHLQVKTESVHRRQQKIFLPAPVISLDANGVIEDGSILTQNTDFLLYQPADGAGVPKGPGWLERVTTNMLGTFDGDFPSMWFWSPNQQAISVSGHFGYAAVPLEIQKMTAWMAARMLGWVTFTYTQGDGVSKAAQELGIPDWVLQISRNWKNSHFDEQFFQITVLS